MNLDCSPDNFMSKKIKLFTRFLDIPPLRSWRLGTK
jgi:hypothetical protein